MKASIVVPCYNEEESLPLFLAAFDKVASQLSSLTFEILLVDDGSKDGTLALAQKYATQDNRIRVLSFSRNFGKEAGLLAGLTNATGDLVAVMDADLQDPPELLVQMLCIMQETNCDCVVAHRTTRAGEPPIRSFFARMFYKIINWLDDVPVVDGARDFRLMRREMADAILRLGERRRFSKVLFAWVGFDVRYIAYENVERVAGVTKFSFWGLLQYALEGVFSLTTTPLLLPAVFAALSLLACVILLFAGQWLAAALCGAACLVLSAIWLFGLYLARVYWEAKKRPLYITKEDHGE